MWSLEVQSRSKCICTRKALYDAAEPFSLNRDSLDDPGVHFTAKRSKPDSFCTLSNLRTYLCEKRGAEAEKALWIALCDMVYKVMAAGAPEAADRANESNGHRPRNFEFFGFDVLVDDDLRPWILEVNSQPDLSSKSPKGDRFYPVFHDVKSSVVADLLTLIWSKQQERHQDFCGFVALHSLNNMMASSANTASDAYNPAEVFAH